MLAARLRSHTPTALAFLLAAAILLAGGLSLDGVQRLWARVWPILLFLALMAVLAELLDFSGAFRWTAGLIERWGRGSTRALFGWFCLLCTCTTVLLSIDTTAVLLTPVAIAVTRRLRIDPLPFVFAALWLANTASLLLPISNLTNLLAAHSAGLSTSALVELAAVPQLAVVVVTVVVLLFSFRAELRGHYRLATDEGAEEYAGVDSWLLVASGVSVCALLGGLLVGLAAWWGALAAVVVLWVALRLRGRSQPAGRRPTIGDLPAMVPWSALLLALALFVIVGWLAGVLLGPRGPWHQLELNPHQLLVTGAAVGNLTNNLPAYLLLEPIASNARSLVGLLIGVNAGALLTPWGSLATVLWLHICRRRSVPVSGGMVLGYGLVLVPPVLLAGALAL